MLQADILSQISERLPNLSHSEKKVAQVILEDLNLASHASISQLAKMSEVSEATITRFAKAIGCHNVRDMKIKLAQGVAVGQRFLLDAPPQEEDNGVYQAIFHTLNHHRQLIKHEDIQIATQWLHQARQVICIGMGGGSTMISQEMQNRLFRLGYPVVAYNDGLLSRMIAATADQSDVMFLASATGHTPALLEVAQLSCTYGLNTIAMTPKNSPLAKIVHLTLPIEHDETDFIFKPSASRYAMLALVDILATNLALQHKNRSRNKLRRLKVALDSHRGGSKRLPLGD